MRRQVAVLALAVIAAACSDTNEVSGPAESRAFSTGADAGSVYSMSNSPAGNAVIAFRRAQDGSLAYEGAYPTGGFGTGAGLGNQGAVTISADGRWLFVVNAGSGSVSAFRRAPDGSLALRDTEPAGGVLPVSVTARGSLVYVLNAGSGNIAGFRLSAAGDLSPIAGSDQAVSQPGAGAAQISFTGDGGQLVVTERLTNRILVFALDAAGAAQPATVNPASGSTPFGFAFDNRGRLVTSNAMGGAALAGTVSSYEVRPDGTLSVLDGAVPDFQTAPCWLVTSRDGRFAYTTNAGSRTISTFAIDAQGNLGLLGDPVPTTGAPTDVAATREGAAYLYALSQGAGAIDAFRILPGGTLERVPGGATGMPTGMNGLAAF